MFAAVISPLARVCTYRWFFSNASCLSAYLAFADCHRTRKDNWNGWEWCTSQPLWCALLSARKEGHRLLPIAALTQGANNVTRFQKLFQGPFKPLSIMTSHHFRWCRNCSHLNSHVGSVILVASGTLSFPPYTLWYDSNIWEQSFHSCCVGNKLEKVVPGLWWLDWIVANRLCISFYFINHYIEANFWFPRWNTCRLHVQC